MVRTPKHQMWWSPWAVQLKLDELTHTLSGARDELIDLEQKSGEHRRRELHRFRALALRLSGTLGRHAGHGRGDRQHAG